MPNLFGGYRQTVPVSKPVAAATGVHPTVAPAQRGLNVAPAAVHPIATVPTHAAPTAKTAMSRDAPSDVMLAHHLATLLTEHAPKALPKQSS